MRWSCVVLFVVAQLSSSRLVHADEPRLKGTTLSLSATLGGEQLCQASRRTTVDGKAEPAAPQPWR